MPSRGFNVTNFYQVPDTVLSSIRICSALCEESVLFNEKHASDMIDKCFTEMGRQGRLVSPTLTSSLLCSCCSKI
jgi:hypothetical protein